MEEQLRAAAIEFEWVALHKALEHVQFASSPHYPFGAFGMLWGSLQAAGIAAIWLMVQYKELRNWAGFVFAGLLVLSTTRGLWLDFQVNNFYRNSNASQLAGMIQEIQQRRVPPGAQ